MGERHVEVRGGEQGPETPSPAQHRPGATGAHGAQSMDRDARRLELVTQTAFETEREVVLDVGHELPSPSDQRQERLHPSVEVAWNQMQSTHSSRARLLAWYDGQARTTRAS